MDYLNRYRRLRHKEIKAGITLVLLLILIVWLILCNLQVHLLYLRRTLVYNWKAQSHWISRRPKVLLLVICIHLRHSAFIILVFLVWVKVVPVLSVTSDVCSILAFFFIVWGAIVINIILHPFISFTAYPILLVYVHLGVLGTSVIIEVVLLDLVVLGHLFLFVRWVLLVLRLYLSISLDYLLFILFIPCILLLMLIISSSPPVVPLACRVIMASILHILILTYILIIPISPWLIDIHLLQNQIPWPSRPTLTDLAHILSHIDH